MADERRDLKEAGLVQPTWWDGMDGRGGMGMDGWGHTSEGSLT